MRCIHFNSWKRGLGDQPAAIYETQSDRPAYRVATYDGICSSILNPGILTIYITRRHSGLRSLLRHDTAFLFKQYRRRRRAAHPRIPRAALVAHVAQPWVQDRCSVSNIDECETTSKQHHALHALMDTLGFAPAIVQRNWPQDVATPNFS